MPGRQAATARFLVECLFLVATLLHLLFVLASNTGLH